MLAERGVCSITENPLNSVSSESSAIIVFCQFREGSNVLKIKVTFNLCYLNFYAIPPSLKIDTEVTEVIFKIFA